MIVVVVVVVVFFFPFFAFFLSRVDICVMIHLLFLSVFNLRDLEKVGGKNIMVVW